MPTILEPAPAGAVFVDEVLGLTQILQPAVNVVVWHRPVVAAIERFAESLPFVVGPPARIVADPASAGFGRRVESLVPAAAAAADPEGAAALAHDAAQLAAAFAELTDADELLVSFEAPEVATCPRFHVDRLGIRLLVTYAGPGTEWIADADCDRSWLGARGHGQDDHSTGLLRPNAVVRRVARFAVVLLKGEAFPGARGFGAVHRSPDPAGAPRLLLRLDVLGQRSAASSAVVEATDFARAAGHDWPPSRRRSP
jgi:hypothetical protein